MDTLAEVQLKMRSAVKAKLLELKISLITEELPDYIMVMIANKRSKSQMIEDLSLFLGEQTEIFVAWLSEVLRKLNQVTLTNAKKQAEAAEVSSKKDKKDKKKDKKDKKGSKTSTAIDPVSKPITDVFAEDLIEKAKKTLEIESRSKSEVKKEEKKGRTPDPPSPPRLRESSSSSHRPTTARSDSRRADDFDIPTISEIAENAVEQHLHKRELTQLQELQKQINLAKKQLKSMLTDSEEEEYLNLEEIDDIDAIEKLRNKIERSRESRKESEAEKYTPSAKKPSALSRLGVKATENSKPDNVISLSAHRKTEREFYIPPNFRKSDKHENASDSKEANRSVKERIGRRFRNSNDKDEGRERNRRNSRDRDRSRSPHRGRSRERDRRRERSRDRSGDRSRDKERDSTSTKSKANIHQRIGSRVIVMPPKPVYDEEEVDVPINSVVKIKPRTQVPPSRQASKNLLLKAVAEAQKSTANAPKSKWDEKKNDYYRRDASKTSSRGNLKIQITRNETEEEYVPEPVSTQSESDGESYRYSSKKYGPADEGDEEDVLELNNFEDEDFEENLSANKSPQFVVTLEGIYNKKRIQKDEEEEEELVEEEDEKSPTPPPVVPRRSIKDRIGVPWRNENNIKTNDNKKSNTPEITETMKRSKVQPIKFDLTDDERRSSSREIDDHPAIESNENGKSETNDKESKGEKRKISETEEHDDEHVKKIKKLAPTRNFDHVPSLSSVIVSSVVAPVKLVKSKERCKFFPACRLGDNCEFHHPTMPCKLFPNCKFGDKCAYLHPRCKFDTNCLRSDCNFMHTPIVPASPTSTSLPPLASSIVAVSTYKSIGPSQLTPLCKFYPHCTNSVCTFFHPKLCRFGKNCLNKLECNFYHYDIVA